MLDCLTVFLPKKKLYIFLANCVYTRRRKVRERETKFKLPINIFFAFCLRLEEVEEKKRSQFLSGLRNNLLVSYFFFLIIFRGIYWQRVDSRDAMVNILVELTICVHQIVCAVNIVIVVRCFSSSFPSMFKKQGTRWT